MMLTSNDVPCLLLLAVISRAVDNPGAVAEAEIKAEEVVRKDEDQPHVVVMAALAVAVKAVPMAIAHLPRQTPAR